jgi:hypothetical protein
VYFHQAVTLAACLHLCLASVIRGCSLIHLGSEWDVRKGVCVSTTSWLCLLNGAVQCTGLAISAVFPTASICHPLCIHVGPAALMVAFGQLLFIASSLSMLYQFTTTIYHSFYVYKICRRMSRIIECISVII